MSRNILSVDFDYFVLPTKEQLSHFPDGAEQGEKLTKLVWANIYAQSKLTGGSMDCIRVERSKLDFITALLKRNKNAPYMITDSHKFAHEFVSAPLSKGEKVNIYNIDFHHDTYINTDDAEVVNCGNWLRRLFEGNKVEEAYWVARTKSSRYDKLDRLREVSFFSLPKSFDMIYACRSGWWSPPSLDRYFVDAIVKPLLSNDAKGIVEDRVTVSRQDNAFCDMIDQFYDALIKAQIFGNKKS